MEQIRHSNYRPEIDGLRAIAVVAVILFHAGYQQFKGGFIGVDIFFVISGFLITSIIVKDLEAGSFSFAGFYERRARRILPALILVVACTSVFAWIWMFPDDMKTFGQSVAAVGLFVSNFFFYSQTGYFDQSSDLKPLLHTWSLAIEEQYYIVFPLLMVLLWRLSRKWVLPALVGLALVSLALSQWYALHNRELDFFGPHTRAWELLAGAICSFLDFKPRLLVSNIMAALGLGATLFSIFYFDQATPFPSLWALVPVLGTCLILLFAREATLARRVLGFQPFVCIGLISYSLYLWHQPVFAMIRFRTVMPLDIKVMPALIALTLVLAVLSWRFIELPFRRKGAIRTIPAVVGLAGGIAALIIFGVTANLEAGFPSRIPQDVLTIAEAARDIGSFHNECLDGPELSDRIKSACHLGVKGDQTDFVFFGDSYAASLADGVNVAARNAGKSGLFMGLYSCVPIVGAGSFAANSTDDHCAHFQNAMLNVVDALKPKSVILFSRWKELSTPEHFRSLQVNTTDGTQVFRNPLLSTLQEFQRRGITVYFVCCVPQPPFSVYVPASYAKMRLFGTYTEIRAPLEVFKYDNRAAFGLMADADINSTAKMIDMTQTFCGQDFCDLMRNNYPLLFDGGHLTKTASLSLAEPLSVLFPE